MTNLEVLLLVIVVGPIILGGVAWALGAGNKIRNALAVISAIGTAIAGIWFCFEGRFNSDIEIPFNVPHLVQILEALVTFIIFLIGIRVKSYIVVIITLFQMAIMAAGHALAKGVTTPESAAMFRLDALSATLVLIISIIGSAIVVYATGYMKRHQEHAPSTAASSGKFFFFLIAFLGFMNGLVLADNMKWLAFFWECTTLCSFFLIRHDGTVEARKNSRTALIINAMGGAGMSLAGFISFYKFGNESISGLINMASAGAGFVSVGLLVVALLFFATCTKSAQLPFQSWLLGAMVAPTPVSALLHSSTMVKAGSYLVLRMAPVFGDSIISMIVALCGAFTFAIASALAIGQSNGKKVLAYSTIANLGLIVACAGINTELALIAGIVILVYHAITKALLFMCVGAIEQQIGSRDIEDMGGVMHRMPLTATIAAIGMASMIMPPMGMLIGKWLALESVTKSPFILMLLVIGSALTVFFWAKWIGRIITSSHHEKYEVENIPYSVKIILSLNAMAVVFCSLCVVPVYMYLIKPVAAVTISSTKIGVMSSGAIDYFMTWPIYLIMFVVLISILFGILIMRRNRISKPFLCGENVDGGTETYEFRSLMDLPEKANVTGYYYTNIFGENRLTTWANLIAVLILITLFARVLIG